MVKLHTVVGARPQFIKASALDRVLRSYYSGLIEETLIHSGQHYDDNMSASFFRELELQNPKHNLGVKPGRPAVQTAMITIELHKLWELECPDAVLVYGDTNTTLGGALAASDLEIPLIHVEAGLRSYNRGMPEEVNRHLTDHLSSILACPVPKAVEQLAAEGITDSETSSPDSVNPRVILCGDVMYDNALYFESKSRLPQQLLENDFVLFTLHRAGNTDDGPRLKALLKTVFELSRDTGIAVYFPCHPRTRTAIDMHYPEFWKLIRDKGHFHFKEPTTYFETLALEKHARFVVTDSGGIPKEAYFFGTPSIILRTETEWNELVENTFATLVDADRDLLAHHWHRLLGSPGFDKINGTFGNGDAAEQITREIWKVFG
ncbi:MAG: UDP-N-acetylglucosamine 2-epimerase (non-hydrolyzing) [Flavobacteriales bacterium]|nr:UDP-N-acetylglucosamine 2-epimerase (non-hydrolyzing) [Flavobacteriales bacterium]